MNISAFARLPWQASKATMIGCVLLETAFIGYEGYGKRTRWTA